MSSVFVGYKFNNGTEFVSTFDVIAILLKIIKDSAPEYFTRQVKIETLAYPEEVAPALQDIEETIGLYAKHSLISVERLLTVHGIPKSAVEKLDFYTNFSKDIQWAFFLVNKLADLMGQAVLEIPSNFTSAFVCLNANFDSTEIMILPKYKALYDPKDVEVELDDKEKKWADDRQYLAYSYFYIIDSTKLRLSSGTQFNIVNHVINPELYKKNIKDPFVIFISPLTCEKMLDLSFKQAETEYLVGKEQNVFELNRLYNKESLHKKIEKVFLKSSEHRTDLLVFPEMLGDEVSTSEEFWKKLYDKAEGYGNLGPQFISTPTWWHDNRNEGYVLDNGAKEIFHYQKQIPFSGSFDESGTTEEYIENLKEIDRTIHVLHIAGIGRVIFVICRDLLQADFKDVLLRELRATFLIAPSCSSGTTQFKKVEYGGIPYGCYEIWVNTCSALEEKNKGKRCIGLLTSPISGEQIEIEPNCKLECNGSAATCAIRIEISQEDSILPQKEFYRIDCEE